MARSCRLPLVSLRTTTCSVAGSPGGLEAPVRIGVKAVSETITPRKRLQNRRDFPQDPGTARRIGCMTILPRVDRQVLAAETAPPRTSSAETVANGDRFTVQLVGATLSGVPQGSNKKLRAEGRRPGSSIPGAALQLTLSEG